MPKLDKKQHKQMVFSTQVGELASWIKKGVVPKDAPKTLYSIHANFNPLFLALSVTEDSLLSDYKANLASLPDLEMRMATIKDKVEALTFFQRAVTQNSHHAALLLEYQELEEDHEILTAEIALLARNLLVNHENILDSAKPLLKLWSI